MTEPASRLKANILAAGFGSHLYTVTLVVSKTIDRNSHVDDYLLA